MSTNNHPTKDKAHKLRPQAGTASKHPASINESRKPNVSADGFQEGSPIDRLAKKNWESGRDNRAIDKS
jgi:hypothetical protein